MSFLPALSALSPGGPLAVGSALTATWSERLLEWNNIRWGLPPMLCTAASSCWWCWSLSRLAHEHVTPVATGLDHYQQLSSSCVQRSKRVVWVVTPTCPLDIIRVCVVGGCGSVLQRRCRVERPMAQRCGLCCVVHAKGVSIPTRRSACSHAPSGGIHAAEATTAAWAWSLCWQWCATESLPRPSSAPTNMVAGMDAWPGWLKGAGGGTGLCRSHASAGWCTSRRCSIS